MTRKYRYNQTWFKKIVKRKWTTSDMTNRAVLMNAAIGLSPFVMVDFTKEDVVFMKKIPQGSDQRITCINIRGEGNPENANRINTYRLIGMHDDAK